MDKDRLWNRVRLLWEQLRNKARQPHWQVLLTVLLIGPAIAVIGLRTYQNWDVLRQHTWCFRPGFWAAALLGYSLALLSLLWAWNRIMGQLGGVYRFRTNARIYCLSNLSKRIPGAIWYMVGRVHFYQGEGVRTSVTLAGTALETVLLAATGIVTVLFVQPFAQTQWSFRLGAALLVLPIALIILQPPVFNRIVHFFLDRLGSDAQVEISYRGLFPVFAAYLAGWILPGIGLYMLVTSFYPLPWKMLPDIVGAWALAGTMGLLVATFLLGSGVREITLSFLLVAHMPQPMAVLAAVLFWLVIMVGETLWAGVFVLLGRLDRRGRENTASKGGTR